MTQEISGRCKCGKVSYRGTRSDVETFRCYCRDCQQLTGTGHSEMVPLLAETVEIEGPLKEYRMTARSGRSTWSGFCSECGSQLFRRSEASPDRRYAHAASLDDPGVYEPARSIYVESAQAWDQHEV